MDFEEESSCMVDIGSIDWSALLLLLVKPVIGAVITSSLVTSIVIYRDRKKLKSGDRSGYVSVSINYEHHSELHYGPLFERPLEDILRNSQAVKIVNQAIKKKKKEVNRPVILLDVKSARFVYERIGDYVAEILWSRALLMRWASQLLSAGMCWL
ncbi:hypothetical protein C2W62_47995 [Candidatus Entotheonella serta]|nr:hypothetical protein C2W62_47995 [Candidatus Entotheonella serta]